MDPGVDRDDLIGDRPSSQIDTWPDKHKGQLTAGPGSDFSDEIGGTVRAHAVGPPCPRRCGSLTRAYAAVYRLAYSRERLSPITARETLTKGQVNSKFGVPPC